jgi:hypothetical protein
MPKKLLVSNDSWISRFVLGLFLLICLNSGLIAQGSVSRTTIGLATVDEQERHKKPHYVVYPEDASKQEHLVKCVEKYPHWHKHRMLSKRRIIEVRAPYSAKIELYSEQELSRLYGKQIAPELSDSLSDYYDIQLQVTPNGFKEIILSAPKK